MIEARDDLIRWFVDCRAVDAEVVGAKVAGLGELMSARFAVPRGFVLTVRACAELVADEGSGLFRMPPAMRTAVEQAYGELCAASPDRRLPVAVRSSSPYEDLPGASWAGQLKTILGVAGAEDLFAAICECLSSQFEANARTYGRQMGFADVAKQPLAIGIQEMVDARAAGVMFTLDPSNGDRSVVAIEAGSGLGSQVTAGGVTPWLYVLDKSTGALIRSRGTMTDRPEGPLDSNNLRGLAEIGTSAERHFGHPLDIEWAISADGRIWLLQARHETVWSSAERRSPAAPRGSAVDYVADVLLQDQTGETPVPPRGGRGA